ncbi:MAG: hypothetical protein R3E58_00355 [Phycisphaerae bacterium]
MAEADESVRPFILREIAQLCSSTYTKAQTNQANRRSGNQPERNWPTSEVCLRGPGGRLLGGCECLDLDDDGDNDLQDFLIFLQAMN